MSKQRLINNFKIKYSKELIKFDISESDIDRDYKNLSESETLIRLKILRNMMIDLLEQQKKNNNKIIVNKL